MSEGPDKDIRTARLAVYEAKNLLEELAQIPPLDSPLMEDTIRLLDQAQTALAALELVAVLAQNLNVISSPSKDTEPSL